MPSEQPSNNNRVRIYRRDGVWVVDTGGRKVPSCHELTPYFPASLKSLGTSYLSVQEAVGNGNSPQSLSLALSAYYTEHPNVGEVRVIEGESIIPDSAAYMALGDNIYKMVPVRQVSGARAYRLMRERIRVEGERLMTGLKAQAQQEAQGILQRANEQAAIVRAVSDRQTVETFRVPRWLIGYAVFMDDYGLKVQWKLFINIVKLSHGNLSWDALPGSGFHADVWIPLRANPEHVGMVSRTGPWLPHVRLSSCITLGERWKAITSFEELSRFAGAISRALQVINLASLLCPDATTWDARVLAFVPPAIKAWLETHRDNRSQHSSEGLSAPTVTNEGADSWNL